MFEVWYRYHSIVYLESGTGITPGTVALGFALGQNLGQLEIGKRRGSHVSASLGVCLALQRWSDVLAVAVVESVSEFNDDEV